VMQYDGMAFFFDFDYQIKTNDVTIYCFSLFVYNPLSSSS